VSLSAHTGSPLIHSLPQLSGSPVLRGHAGRCVNIDNASKSSTVPSLTTTRSDMEQLQLQLQQRLSQQRVRNEHNTSGWRPASECVMTADTQNVPAPAPFSRYSAPPAAGALVKSGSGVRPATAMYIPSPSQHSTATAAMSSSSSSVAMRPGQPSPAPAKPVSHSQPSGPAKSSVIAGCTPAVTSSATVGRSSPTVGSQHVRYDSLCALFSCYVGGKARSLSATNVFLLLVVLVFIRFFIP